MFLGPVTQVHFCGMVETNCANNIVLRGSKYFWHTKNSIKVTIVSHTEFAITEVIAYDPLLDVEGNRIYLNSNILCSMLSQDGTVTNQINLPRAVSDADMSDYLLSHLSIKERIEDGELKFVILLHDNDEKLSASARLICDKPAGLQPFTAANNKLRTESDKMVTYVSESNLKGQCANAIGTHEMRAPLSHKERWRIPVVLVKISRNRSLNEVDSKIWAAVSFNLQAHEQMDRSAHSTLFNCALNAADGTPARDSSVMPLRCVCYTPTPSQSSTPNLTPRNLTYPTPPNLQHSDNSVAIAGSQNEESGSAHDSAPEKACIELLKCSQSSEISPKSKLSPCTSHLSTNHGSTCTLVESATMNGSDDVQGALTCRNYVFAGLAALVAPFVKTKVHVAKSDDGDEMNEHSTNARRTASVSVRTTACTSAPTSPLFNSAVTAASMAVHTNKLSALNSPVRQSVSSAHRSNCELGTAAANPGYTQQDAPRNGGGALNDNNGPHAQPPLAWLTRLFFGNKVSPESLALG